MARRIPEPPAPRYTCPGCHWLGSRDDGIGKVEGTKLVWHCPRCLSVCKVDGQMPDNQPRCLKCSALLGAFKRTTGLCRRCHKPQVVTIPRQYWSEADCALLEKLFCAGKSDEEIARAMGRTEMSVSVQRKRMRLMRRHGRKRKVETA